MSIEEKAPGRIAYLDIARAIAIVSITLNHAVNRSFSVYSGQSAEFFGIPLWMTVFKTVFCVASRIGVPLFLMITGALMLTRDYDGAAGGRFIKRNWLSLLITTEVWLTIMYWFKQFLYADSALFKNGIASCLLHYVLTLFFINPITMDSMWYMSMILCLYLMIPIFSAAIKKLDKRYFLIPLLLVTVSAFLIPDINGALGAVGSARSLEFDLRAAHCFSMYAVYLFLGYYCSRGVLSKLKTGTVTLILSASVLAYCAFQMWIFSRPFDYVVGYDSIFPMITAVPLFELLRRKTGQAEGAGHKIAAFLSGISFGIYFVHICIMEALVVLIDRFHWELGHVGRFFFLEIVSFGGSVLLIWLLSRSKTAAKVLFRMKS